MSDAMVIYSVSYTEMRQLLGSGNHDILGEIHEEDPDFLTETDSIFEDQWEDEEPLTAEVAIGHLLDGGPYREGCEALYLYAFESLCRCIGSSVDNRAFQPPIRWGWIEQVDRYLASISFPLRVAGLASGGLPFTFPYDDCLPSIGHWPRQHYAVAAEQLRTLRLDGEEISIAESLLTILGALDESLKFDDDILIGIYS